MKALPAMFSRRERTLLTLSPRSFRLSEFQRDLFVPALSGPADGISGVTFSPVTGTLFAIRNVSSGQSATYEYDLKGTLLRTITHSNFTDTEGIAWISGNMFAISEENAIASVTFVTIDPGQVTLDRNNFLTKTFPTGVAQANLSIEGCAYDARRDCVYWGPEKSSAGNSTTGTWNISKMDRATGAVTILFSLITAIGTPAIGTDLADIAYDPMSDTLFLLCEESDKIVRVTLEGTVLETLSLVGFNQPEGLGFSPDFRYLFVTGESREYGRYIRRGTTPPIVAPVTTAATSVTVSGFQANWNRSVNTTGYLLDVATDAGFTAIVSGYNGLDVGNVNFYGVTGLAAGTTYYYRVRAYNPAGVFATNSNVTSQLTASSAPATPAQPVSSAPTSTTFLVSWSSVATSTGYRLDVATDAAFTSYVSGFQDLDVGLVLSKTVTGLSESTQYFYRVRAYNASGTSASSPSNFQITSGIVRTLKLQVNATTVTPVVGGGDPVNEDDPGLEIFSRSNTVFADAEAMVDDLCFYNRVLSDGEVGDYIGFGIPAGPLVCLSFDGGGLGDDSSGNANHFTNNGCSASATGYGGNGAKCDGGNLTLPEISTSNALRGMDLSNGGFSICGRYKPTQNDINSGFALCFASFLGSTNGTWGIDLRAEGLTCYLHIGSGVYTQIAGGTFVADEWHSFVFRFERA